MSAHKLSERLLAQALAHRTNAEPDCAALLEEAAKALAAHEQQQAGEAVARVRVTSVTPGRFDEIDVLRPLPQGEHLLFTHPQQPLTDEQVAKIEAEIWNVAWLDETEQQSNREFARAIQRELGITKDTK